MKLHTLSGKIAILLTILFALSALTACGSTPAAVPENENGDTLHIVTTIFPAYDWVMNILGDNPSDIEVTLLLDNGVDMHSYQPTVADILAISTCDLFIYVGGESDEWIDDALREAETPDMRVINMMDVLSAQVREEEIVEGMTDDEGDGQDGDDAEAPEYDEHVWLSLRNAEIVCEHIAKAVEELDPANEEAYIANSAAYIDTLHALDSEYQSAVAAANKNTMLFGDRFPFRYMVDDYGISYYAAFPGCSSETEASFETITFLAGKIDELSLSYVMTIENSSDDIANAIIRNTAAKNQEILILDSMQSVTRSGIDSGVSYIGVMERNLEVLKQALK